MLSTVRIAHNCLIINVRGAALRLPFPMYVALNMVKMKACRNATSNSRVIINKESGMEAAIPAAEPPVLSPDLPRMKIRLTKDKITMCPAVMLAKRRRSKVNGLRNTPEFQSASG